MAKSRRKSAATQLVAQPAAGTKAVPSQRVQEYLKVADIATLLSLFCGVAAFVFVLDDRLALAGIAMLGSVLFDVLDGRIARLMGQSSEFGMYLDSLVDAMVFGMIPAVIAIVLQPTSLLLIVAAVFFASCGAYRLARFQHSRLSGEFQGVPITVNGVLVGIMLLLDPQRTYNWLWPAYFIVMGILMASTIRIRKV